MALDGIVLRALTCELKEKIINSKIDKIYQPEKDELVFNLRGFGENFKLLLSASSNNPRIHFFHDQKTNPQVPPMFCMLLRKHIAGGRIVDIRQEHFERIIYIDIQTTNELGDQVIRRLIVEIMGKHSNLILVNNESGKIMDSIKRITPDMSRLRQILPGMTYELPPAQDKISLLELSQENFNDILKNSNASSLVYKFLYQNILGLSPVLAKELCKTAYISENLMIGELDSKLKNSLFISLIRLQNIINSNYFKPSIAYDDSTEKVLEFSCIELSQFRDSKNISYDSMSDVIEIFYKKRDLFERLKQKSVNLRKTIQTQLDRNLHKKSNLLADMDSAKKRDKYRVYGELITANLHLAQNGDESLECLNFYTNEMITIPLDPRFSPAKNAQKYFKKYSKLKTANILLEEQLVQTQSTIDYLENVLISIDQCESKDELQDIFEELSAEKIIKSKSNKKKTYKSKSKPYHYVSSDGIDIFVGKNNYQNDNLTLRFAEKDDLWLHAKNIPGSHVIIKSNLDDLPDRTLEEAAMLAAFYSKARNSSTVPIDYALKKNVKKPNSAKPGMVIYENNYTIYITPDELTINNLKKLED
jgi:predicted ribosome quality control (RQC) complex YloA/Tae2 family protein